MRLNRHDRQNIMDTFPPIELSYEKITHKKVSSANLFLTIPKGKKYFTWFRYFKGRAVCFFMELDRRRKKINEIVVHVCCFSELLCTGLGTILYGTLFQHDDRKLYNIEDIFYSEGNVISRSTQLIKLRALRDLFHGHLRQVVLSQSDVIFGLPIICSSRADLIKQIAKLPYRLYCIQHRFTKKHPSYFNEKIVQNIISEKLFMVRATLYDDIYTLYYRNKTTDTLEPHSPCLIPDYKTSVFMNGLFRDIKENQNLDTLEESDDEEEFENISSDKYVNLDKECKVLCVYVRRFRLWRPIQHLEKGHVCLKSDITRIEKNNRH